MKMNRYFRSLAFVSMLMFFGLRVSSQNTNLIDASLKTSSNKMNEFMDMRFGMFIHWGPVTLRGTEIGWSRGHEVAQDDYDNLYKEFNPILFNADAWVKAAKSAGMKYLTITSKHHDGFCLWPSANTNYDIMSSPYKKDIVGALAQACKRQGIKFCIYFTILDWHDKNYPVHNDGKGLYKDGNMDAFRTTMKNELKELVIKYDPYMLWFDGGWEEPWTDEMGVDIYTYLKGLKKDLIINNRLGKEMTAIHSKEVDHTKMIGDYDTPEQQIGKINMEFPWESCITICSQWAWKPNDKLKSLKDCLHTLIKTASGNGNLLFNVGPMPDGRMEQRQIARLKQIGDWLKKYGESIYETKGGPYTPNTEYSSTRKGNKIFVHLFETDKKEILLPILPCVKLQKATLMNGSTLKFKEMDNQYHFTLPVTLPDNVSNVLVLQLDKNVMDTPIIKSEK
jgi:alpha-L-fucosidase